MSAFALQPTGPEVRCDFRGCILNAWHDGDHEFEQQKKPIAWTYDRHCVVCGIPFTVIGVDKSLVADTCGSEACLLRYAHRFRFPTPLVCRCPQRDYPHELSVHTEIRSEWWAHKRNLSWPWSLMASVREEPSTERKVEA